MDKRTALLLIWQLYVHIRLVVRTRKICLLLKVSSLKTFRSLAHFQRLMRYISFNVHPLNFGDHTNQISCFLVYFMSSIKERLNTERLSWKKRNCSKEYYLKDSDIDEITESVTDLAIMLMFNDQNVSLLIFRHSL